MCLRHTTRSDVRKGLAVRRHGLAGIHAASVSDACTVHSFQRDIQDTSIQGWGSMPLIHQTSHPSPLA